MNNQHSETLACGQVCKKDIIHEFLRWIYAISFKQGAPTDFKMKQFSSSRWLAKISKMNEKGTYVLILISTMKNRIKMHSNSSQKLTILQSFLDIVFLEIVTLLACHMQFPAKVQKCGSHMYKIEVSKHFWTSLAGLIILYTAWIFVLSRETACDRPTDFFSRQWTLCILLSGTNLSLICFNLTFLTNL